MKILLTGSEGQVGSSVVERMPTIIACNRKMLDITDISSVKNAVEKYSPNIIINCAAYTAVDKAETEQEKAYAVNAKGPENLAKVCAENNILLIHLSTDYVFDGEKNSSYVETDMPNPQSIYGKSKWEGEKAIQQYCKNYMILRVSWVFGEYGNNFVKTILRISKERDVLKIVADQKGCPTYAGDIADVVLAIAKKPVPGIYHYSNTPATNWCEFARAVVPAKKIQPITTADYPMPAKRPQNSVLDCQLFEKTFNILRQSWKKGLEKVLHATK